MKKRRSDLLQVERALLWLARQHQVTVTDLAAQAMDISELPPEFLDGSVVDLIGEQVEIILGFHPDPEIRVLALAHELGHVLAPFDSGLTGSPVMERETVAWLWVIRFFKRRFPRLKLSLHTVARAIHMLKSYEDAVPKRRMPNQMWRQFGRLRSRT